MYGLNLNTLITHITKQETYDIVLFYFANVIRRIELETKKY